MCSYCRKDKILDCLLTLLFTSANYNIVQGHNWQGQIEVDISFAVTTGTMGDSYSDCLCFR